jgi:hypothetical protein
MTERFGCRTCWPESADEADAARRLLDDDQDIVDEPHFQVRIRRCPGCSQAFVTVLAEKDDGAGGDNSQSWVVMPILPDEAVDLMLEGASLRNETLTAIGPERKSLAHDHPAGKQGTSRWRTGIGVGPHD